jgi:hypothetical protein
MQNNIPSFSRVNHILYSNISFVDVGYSPTLTESPTGFPTSVLSSSSSLNGEGSPGAPNFENPPTSAPTSPPRCCQEFALNYCFFKFDTTRPCDIKVDLNGLLPDEVGEDGSSVPLPDNANENDDGVITSGKGGKGIGKAGSKGTIYPGKAGSKGGKSTGKAGIGKAGIGKAGIGKTGTDNERRRRKLELKKKIERHLSSIDDLNKVLMRLDKP